MLYDNILPREEKEITQSLIPDLAPLKKSWEWNAFEHDVKNIFLDLFEDHLRKQEREANVYGMPHLGSFELVSRNVGRDGLSLLNNEDEPAMRYLFKAWRARNPKRGFHFLRTYLQLIWPNSWELDQQWQDKNKPYPTALAPARYINTATNDDASDTHYLTCRVVASIEFDGNPFDIKKIEPAIRSSLGAEFLFELRVLVKLKSSTIGLSNGCAISQVIDLSGCFGFLPSHNKCKIGFGNLSSTGQIINLAGSIKPLFDPYQNNIAITSCGSIDQIVDFSGIAKFILDKPKNTLCLSGSMAGGQVVNLYGKLEFGHSNCSSNALLSCVISSGDIVNINGDIAFYKPPFKETISLASTSNQGQIIRLNHSLEFKNKKHSEINLSNGMTAESKVIMIEGKLEYGDD